MREQQENDLPLILYAAGLCLAGNLPKSSHRLMERTEAEGVLNTRLCAVVQEQFDDLDPAVKAGHMQGCIAFRVSRMNVRMVLKQHLDERKISLPGARDQRGLVMKIPCLDVGAL